MQSDKILFLKDFGSAKLFMTVSGKTMLFWSLTPRQQQFLGKKISPFFCFRNIDLCARKLKRPHLTCFFCKLRKVVTGQLPLLFEIQIHQVWSVQGKSSFKQILFKNVLSLAEALS
jgi:hypothetical protein